MSPRWPTVSFWLVLLTCTWAANAGDIRLGTALRSELLTLEPISGKLNAVDLDNHVVVVSFFASWCPPCRTEFEHLNVLNEEFGNKVSVIAINVFESWDDNDAARMQRFLEDTKPSFPVVVGTEDIKRAFGEVQRIPTVFVFDTAGVAAMRFVHQRDAEKMTVGIDELREAVRAGLSY